MKSAQESEPAPLIFLSVLAVGYYPSFQDILTETISLRQRFAVAMRRNDNEARWEQMFDLVTLPVLLHFDISFWPG